MSVESMMKRSFEKYSERKITIIRPATKTGQLNSVKKVEYEILKSASCYFNNVVSDSETDEGGKKTSYNAKALVIYDDIIDIESIINSSCRILSGEHSDLNDSKIKDAWLIDLIRPVSRIDGFWIIQFDISKPMAGNRVELS